MEIRSLRLPSGNQVQVDTKATCCPLCNHHIEPKPIADIQYTLQGNNNFLEMVYQCPQGECQRLFLARYKHDPLNRCHRLHYIGPKVVSERKFSTDIKGLSESFDLIYNQSRSAEMSELDAIAGVGYRKALEFLIKDYCIHKEPAATEQIKAAPLAKVINNRIDNDKIKRCAVGAVWIGNDETHYTRKWEAKDINDLKIFIDLTVHWIESELLTDRLTAEMGI